MLSICQYSLICGTAYVPTYYTVLCTYLALGKQAGVLGPRSSVNLVPFFYGTTDFGQHQRTYFLSEPLKGEGFDPPQVLLLELLGSRHMDWPDTQDIRYIISVSTGRHMPLSYDHDGAAEQSSLDDQLEAASDESERAIVNALNRLRKQRALKQV